MLDKQVNLSVLGTGTLELALEAVTTGSPTGSAFIYGHLPLHADLIGEAESDTAWQCDLRGVVAKIKLGAQNGTAEPSKPLMILERVLFTRIHEDREGIQRGLYKICFDKITSVR